MPPCPPGCQCHVPGAIKALYRKYDGADFFTGIATTGEPGPDGEPVFHKLHDQSQNADLDGPSHAASKLGHMWLFRATVRQTDDFGSIQKKFCARSEAAPVSALLAICERSVLDRRRGQAHVCGMQSAAPS